MQILFIMPVLKLSRRTVYVSDLNPLNIWKQTTTLDLTAKVACEDLDEHCSVVDTTFRVNGDRREDVDSCNGLKEAVWEVAHPRSQATQCLQV